MSESVPTNPAVPGAEFISLLHTVLHRIRNYTETQLKPVGLAPGQYRLLQILMKNKDPMRMVDIAQQLHIAQRSVTSKVQDAEREGLVHRSVDPADRRACLVELTTAGKHTLDVVTKARHAQANALLETLDAGEQTQLIALLQRIAEAAQ